MSRKIRALIVIDSLNIGGAEKQLAGIFRQIERSQLEPVVCSLSADNNYLAGDFKSIGIPVDIIGQSGFFDYSCLSRLAGYIRKLNPDLVHTFLFTSDCYGRLAAKIAGVCRVISSARSPDCWKKQRHILADKLLAKITTRFIANSLAVKDSLIKIQGIDPKKIEVIYNGVDLREYSPLSENGVFKESLGIPSRSRVVSMVTRFAPEKDIATFIKAARLLSGRRADIYFIIAGHGELEDKLKQEVCAAGMRGRVIFLIQERRIAQVLGASDISVLTSLYEGCSNVILESMAMAKPVVATEVGGNRELVLDGETGFLVPARDASSLAHKIECLIRDSRLAENMGAAGRKRAAEFFSIEKSARETLRLYRAVMDLGQV